MQLFQKGPCTNRALHVSVALSRRSLALCVGTLPMICILAMYGHVYGMFLSSAGTEVRSTDSNVPSGSERWRVYERGGYTFPPGALVNPAPNTSARIRESLSKMTEGLGCDRPIKRLIS